MVGLLYVQLKVKDMLRCHLLGFVLTLKQTLQALADLSTTYVPLLGLCGQMQW